MARWLAADLIERKHETNLARSHFLNGKINATRLHRFVPCTRNGQGLVCGTGSYLIGANASAPLLNSAKSEVIKLIYGQIHCPLVDHQSGGPAWNSRRTVLVLFQVLIYFAWRLNGHSVAINHA